MDHASPPAAFVALGDLISATARQTPDRPAVIDGSETLSYGQLDELSRRVAAGLMRDGSGIGSAAALCAANSAAYVAVFVGAVRAGVAAVPLPVSATLDALRRMLDDSGARHLFADASVPSFVDEAARGGTTLVRLDEGTAAMDAWLQPASPAAPMPALPALRGEEACNIIYSSGTTGMPKGIVQSHLMRWLHVRRGMTQKYGPESVVLLSTPLYSNTTLVSLFAGLGAGSTIVLMRKFDTRQFLELSERHRVTHAMLVPIQYRRLLDSPDFDRCDLSSFQMKFSTGAPFPPALKAEVLRRWPGGLIEMYGMTEGGVSAFLPAHEFPDKLHTVGRPAPGCQFRIIGPSGEDLPRGQPGEVVGHTAATMTGYHGRPDLTDAVFWTGPDGLRYLRSGDVGYFDEDGFLVLCGRIKEMIISGGFNIYPGDLEAVLLKHPAVKDAAVVGVPSAQWGETPVAFVALADGSEATPQALRQWANEQLGRTQRLSDLHVLPSLPRNAAGKVQKPVLREQWTRLNEPAPR
ncbi:MAG: class I adenylate-forming enzyme family protein [Burkholderiaceae bacterium]